MKNDSDFFFTLKFGTDVSESLAFKKTPPNNNSESITDCIFNQLMQTWKTPPYTTLQSVEIQSETSPDITQ